MASNFTTHYINPSIFKVTTIESLLIYILSFWVVFFTYQIPTILASDYFGICTELHFNELKFLTSDYSTIWNSNNAIVIFSIGSISVFVLMFVIAYFYWKRRENEELIKTFFLWIILHSLNRILSSHVIGTMLDSYYSNVVLDWILADLWLKLTIIITGFILMVIIGRYLVGTILYSAKYFALVRPKFRSHFLISQIFRPWLIATLLFGVMQFINLSISEMLMHLTMGLFLIPSYFFYHNAKTIRPEKEVISSHKEIYLLSTVTIGITLTLILLLV